MGTTSSWQRGGSKARSVTHLHANRLGPILLLLGQGDLQNALLARRGDGRGIHGDGQLNVPQERAEPPFELQIVVLVVLAPLAAKLRAFAGFSGCDDIVIEEAEPRKTAAALKRELAR